jgi:hypothetical protein
MMRLRQFAVTAEVSGAPSVVVAADKWASEESQH